MRTKKTPQNTFIFLKEKCGRFYREFWQAHQQAIEKSVLTHGHGPEHDLTVAKWCLELTDDQDARELAWVAALVHSIDRLLPQSFPKEIMKSIVDRQLSYLPENYFTEHERDVICRAVRHHDEKNKPDDSDVLIVLKDADRLANLAPEIIMRAGQFAPTVPSFNLKNIDSPDPTGSFGNLKTALDDLYYVLEWVMGEKFWLQPKNQWLEYSKANHWFRTKYAYLIAWEYAQFILRYIEKIEEGASWLTPIV